MTIIASEYHMGKLMCGDLFIGTKIEDVYKNCIKITFSVVNDQLKFEMSPIFSVLFPSILSDIAESKTLTSIPIPESLQVLKDEYIKILENKIEHEEKIYKQSISKLH